MLVDCTMAPSLACNCLIVLATVGASTAAHAQGSYFAGRSDDGVSPARSERSVSFDIKAGGGVLGFVDSEMPSTTAAMWSLRGAVGYGSFAVEVAYIGSVSSIEAEFGRANAVMLGTGVETAIRYTLMPNNWWSPYGFAGVGWQRFTIDDKAFQLSDVGIGNQDDLLVLPLGAGVVYKFGSVVTDVRGTFRAARFEDLVLATPELSLQTGVGGYTPMHTWDASVNIGYVF